MEIRLLKAIELSTDGKDVRHLRESVDLIGQLMDDLQGVGADEISFDNGTTLTLTDLRELSEGLDAFADCLDASWDKPLSVE